MGSRNSVTEMYFPDKVFVEEFVKIITDKDDLEAYVANMRNLDWGSGEHYPEEWIECFAAWMEMNR